MVFLFDLELYIGRHIQELKHVPEPLEFYRNYVSMNQPVVMRGAVRHWPAVRLWTIEYLRLFYLLLHYYSVCCLLSVNYSNYCCWHQVLLLASLWHGMLSPPI